MPLVDGNAEQLRVIIDQVIEARDLRRGSLHDDFLALKEDIDRRIDSKIDSAVTKMKFWVVSAVLTQIVALLPVIFFLGGIYSTNSDALRSIQKLQTTIDSRGQWMSERERWEQGVEQWAKPKGFEPPRYRPVEQ